MRCDSILILNKEHVLASNKILAIVTMSYNITIHKKFKPTECVSNLKQQDDT